MMPTSFKYQVEASNECWSEDPRQGTQKVERDSHVRLRIKGTRSEVGTIFAIGSILEDYLGYISAPMTLNITETRDADNPQATNGSSRLGGLPKNTNFRISWLYEQGIRHEAAFRAGSAMVISEALG